MEVSEDELEVVAMEEEFEVEGPFFSFTVEHLYGHNLFVRKSSGEGFGSLPSL